MSNRWKGGFIQAYFDPLTEGPTTAFLYGWGRNDIGQIGDGTAIDRSSPVQIGSENTWAEVGNYSTGGGAVKNNGTLWTWGLSSTGQLGNNANITSSSPVQVGALTTWSKISKGGADAGAFYAVKTDGSLWGVGEWWQR
jgi:trimeric autotransporter adhesin